MNKKITFILLVCISFSGLLRAQLSGNYTIGGTTPDYATITDALTATQAGITGPVIFNLGAYTERPPFISEYPEATDPGGYEYAFSYASLTTAQISDLMAGLWYVNVTSSAFPDGEIRGQIQPVPEPSTLALLGLGALILPLLLRRSSR